MKHHSSSNPSGRSGFTLIELMVTMAILSIILIMAVQVTETARAASRLTESSSVNDAIARRTFDRIARDLSQMVVREDARIEFTSKLGNDEFAFITRTTGLTAGATVGDRGVSVVSYSLIHDADVGAKLVRGSRGHLFAGSGNDALNLNRDVPFPATPAANLHSLSNNVIRLEIEYLVESVSGVITRVVTAPTTSENLRGLVVTLVTLDDRALRAIKPARLAALAANFPDASTEDTLKVWSDKRNTLAKSGISGMPKLVAQSIHAYQRTFLIQ
jgi:prepilin-type N-terminal cleavage/methylation domain-containing protein